MTVTDCASSNSPSPGIEAMELRWMSVQAPPTRCNGQRGADAGTLCRDEIVLWLQPLEGACALIEMWVDRPPGAHVSPLRKSVLPRQPARCRICRDGELLHIDVHRDGRRVVALSIGPEDRLVYARCDLLADMGFAGGTYQPPMLRRPESKRSAASA